MCLLCGTKNAKTKSTINLGDSRVAEEVRDFANVARDYTGEEPCHYAIERLQHLRLRERKGNKPKKSIDEIILMYLKLAYLGKAKGYRKKSEAIAKSVNSNIKSQRVKYDKKTMVISQVESYISSSFNKNTNNETFVLRITTSSKKRESWYFNTLEEARNKKKEILKTRKSI